MIRSLGRRRLERRAPRPGAGERRPMRLDRVSLLGFAGGYGLQDGGRHRLGCLGGVHGPEDLLAPIEVEDRFGLGVETAQTMLHHLWVGVVGSARDGSFGKSPTGDVV